MNRRLFLMSAGAAGLIVVPAVITNNYFELVGAMLERLQREAAYPMRGLEFKF